MALGALLALAPLAGAADDPEPRRIALSFDDAPTADSALMSGAQRTRALVRELADAGVEQAAFFVTTRNLHTPQAAARLRAYSGAGHVLGNHSHAHLWLSRTPVDDYVADVRQAQSMLAPFDGVRPWYRFPFLDEGRDAGRRDRMREGLAALGLRNGYVTVDNYDWYLDNRAKQAATAGQPIDFHALRRAYVDMLLAAVEFYDGIARDTLGRSPAHVLLLHENDLAALYVGDLVHALRARGWRIVTADEAFGDPIADEAPDTVFNNQGRVAALAAVAGMPRRELVHESEDEAWIDELLERRAVLGGSPMEDATR